MAQAARSVPPAPIAAARREPLRLVPPPRHTAHRPPPGVVRRRRAVALAGLVALIGLPPALLALSGPTGSATGSIVSLLARGAADPSTLCDHLSTGMLQAVGGHAACVRASPARAPGGSVRRVRVHGSTATAIVRTAAGNEHVRLILQDGDWKVDDVR